MAIILNEQSSERLRECVNFCNENPSYWPGFLAELEYLNGYGENDGRKSRAHLGWDFAPLSFGVLIESYYPRNTIKATCTANCTHTGEPYDGDNPGCWWTNSYPVPGIAPPHACPACEAPLELVGPDPEDRQSFTMQGGLIFHGQHDGGGDGGMPTLSVCLTPQDGWSLHT